MLEFLGTILLLVYIVVAGAYLYTAVNKYPSDRLIFKPAIVFLVLGVSFLLLGITLRGCGLDLFEGDSGYYYDRGGPY